MEAVGAVGGMAGRVEGWERAGGAVAGKEWASLPCPARFGWRWRRHPPGRGTAGMVSDLENNPKRGKERR